MVQISVRDKEKYVVITALILGVVDTNYFEPFLDKSEHLRKRMRVWKWRIPVFNT